MPRHVVAPAHAIPPGTRRRVEVRGHGVVIFNLDGDFHALLDRCPHMGGRLSDGVQTGLVESDRPGEYRWSRPGEIIRCPWHAWEFDIRTGRFRCEPDRFRARTVPACVLSGEAVAAEGIDATTVPVTVEGAYLVVEL